MHSLADASSSGSSAGVFLWLLVVYVLFAIPLALVFRKTQTPPWMAFIPIVNIFGLLKTVGRPVWWIILFLIPFVNFIIAIIVYYDLAQSFGHGAGFTVGLVFLPVIFLLILGLNGDQYRGPGVDGVAVA